MSDKRCQIGYFEEKMKKMKRYYGFKIFGFIGFITVAVIGVGLLVMLLWNSLMPIIFGLPAITFVQAIGLLILSRILFGGFPPRGRHHHPRHHWKHRMKEKWANMTPEERAAFKQKMRHWRTRGCWPEEESNKEQEEDKRREEDLV